MKDLHNHLSHLYLFQTVIELGSFQATATKLSMSRSSISKKIRQLEETVGQRLIQRSTRNFKLTEAGHQLLNASISLGKIIEDIQKVIDNQVSTPSGRVKISCTTLTGQDFILPLIQTLHDQYPFITLDLYFNDTYVDFIEEEVDIAVRIGHLPDSSLVAKKIGDKRLAWYASPDYIKQNGYPQTPDDLINHNCLVFKNRTTTLNHWLFKENKNNTTRNIKVKDSITTNDGRSLVEMAKKGLGIIMIYPYLIKNDIKDNKLIPILSNWQHPETQPINLVCLGRNKLSRASLCIWEELSIYLQSAFAENNKKIVKKMK